MQRVNKPLTSFVCSAAWLPPGWSSGLSVALTVIFGCISRKAAYLSLSPAEGTAASLARLAGPAWLRRLTQELELLPAAQL